MKYPKNILMVNPIHYDGLSNKWTHESRKKSWQTIGPESMASVKKVYLNLGFNIIEAPGNEEFSIWFYGQPTFYNTWKSIS